MKHRECCTRSGRRAQWATFAAEHWCSRPPWLEHCDCVSQHVHRAQWATFPLLQLVFQAGDTAALLRRRTHGASLYGADAPDFALAAAGKAAHFALLAGLPWALHGAGAAAAGIAAYMATQARFWAV